MPGLIGVSTHGVGSDIVNYLKEVARFFGVTIRVTSGYRSADGQAQAMFNNWVNLKRGAVYKLSTLPLADRSTLDGYWTTAQRHTASAHDRAQAKADFLKLAKARVGSKSLHTQGRAVDVSRSHITAKVYRAITLRLKEVKEGTRTDIYHFESRQTVPQVDAVIRSRWNDIKGGSSVGHKGHHRGHGILC
jgi:hypothetical protein